MTTGILLMAYGSPERQGDVAAYYTHIRRGRPPSAAQLAELIGRYQAIGGPTALNRITRLQGERLEVELAARERIVPVAVGFKHCPPFIADAVAELAAGGAARAIGLVLAPHFSLRSVAEYRTAALAAAPPDFGVDVIPSWHDDPGLIDVLAVRLTAARAGQGAPLVLFTAHSVPARVLEQGDPYPDQLRRTCELVAARAGVPRWTFAYQSAGRTEEPWLGPDLLEAIEAAADAGERAVVVQPIGFVSDHLEVLYDVDIEARRAAEARGLGFARAAMPNADADFIAVLADVVTRRAAR